MKKWYLSTAALFACMALCSCGNSAASATGSQEMKGPYTDSTIESTDLFSDRDLSGQYDTESPKIILSDQGTISESDKVIISETVITITAEGTYILSGTLNDGMIIVDADKTAKVQLVLDNVYLNSATSAAVYVKQADKVFVTLAQDSVNTLANGGAFVPIDDKNIDAVIYSREDLTLNGTGKLIITSPGGHGIVSKDELVVTDGMYEITAASHGLAGKDSIAVANGSFDIIAGKDGFRSANDEDSTKGWVYIADGHYNIDVQSDGMSAMNEIYIAGGAITITNSYEGLEARIINVCGGEIKITADDDGLNATDKRQETETENQMAVNGKAEPEQGRFDRNRMPDTQEDANINISGGLLYINAEGDGIDSNGYLTVSGGETYVTGSSEGGDAALDYGIAAAINGGIVVAAGQSTMAQNFGLESSQGTILINSQSRQAAGTEVALLNASSTKLIAWTVEKEYNSVVISCPEIKDKSSYTVMLGNTRTDITMNGLIYGSGFGHDGGAGMHGDRPAFHGEGMPQFGEGHRPENNRDRTEGID